MNFANLCHLKKFQGGGMLAIEGGALETVCFGERASEATFGCLDSQRPETS